MPPLRVIVGRTILSILISGSIGYHLGEKSKADQKSEEIDDRIERSIRKLDEQRLDLYLLQLKIEHPELEIYKEQIYAGGDVMFHVRVGLFKISEVCLYDRPGEAIGTIKRDIESYIKYKEYFESKSVKDKASNKKNR